MLMYDNIGLCKYLVLVEFDNKLLGIFSQDWFVWLIILIILLANVIVPLSAR